LKYLIIAAHPDDEVLGCGASMAKWVEQGNQVDVLILSEGATSRDDIRDRDLKSNELSELNRCANNSAKILGINSINLLDFPDNRMDSVDLLDIVKRVEKYIDKIKPEIVLTHHAFDLNIDHQLTHQSVITACRPEPMHYVKRILSFEVPSSTEWQSPIASKTFVPNWYENVSGTLNKKIKALEAYKKEIRDWPHSRSLKGVKSLAEWRGVSVGCEAAEAFMLIREIN
tara:strand:+ start:375 stop:1058 length:684 start_codon:yes stop_codon:yes gene_type:complete